MSRSYTRYSLTRPTLSCKLKRANTDFSFDNLDEGKLLCISIPPTFQAERIYINTFIKFGTYMHLQMRFQHVQEMQDKNLIFVFADEAQKIVTAAGFRLRRPPAARHYPRSPRLLQCKPVFGNYLIVQIDAGGIQASLFGFVPRSSTLIRRCVCFLPESLPPSNRTCRRFILRHTSTTCFRKNGFSALTRAKTVGNNGFRTPLPYVFAARRTVGHRPQRRLRVAVRTAQIKGFGPAEAALRSNRYRLPYDLEQILR